jgi:hypothetical protein
MRGLRIVLAITLIVIAIAAAFEAVNLALGYPWFLSDSLRHRSEALTIALAGLSLSFAWLSWPRRTASKN